MGSGARNTGKLLGTLVALAAVVALIVAGAKHFSDAQSSPDAIIAAADSGNLKELSRRVNAGESLDVLDSSGRSPIVAAIGHPDVTVFLLQHGANPNALLHTGDTLLVRAAESNDIQMIDLLLDHGAKIDERTADGATALISAIVSKSDLGAEELIRRGAAPNVRDAVGATALHYAAGRDRLDLLPVLIRDHAEVNTHTYVGITPLARAILNGHDEAVAFLLAHGAKPYDTDFSLMHYAALAGAYPLQLEYVVTPHLDYHTGPDELRDTEYSYNKTEAIPQAHAASIIAMLAKAGYSVNARGIEGITPLHFAALADNGTAIIALLHLGADRNAKSAHGNTPLDLARRYKCEAAEAVLDAKPTSSRTPIVTSAVH